MNAMRSNSRGRRMISALVLGMLLSSFGTAGVFGLFSLDATSPAEAGAGEFFEVQSYRVFRNADSTDVGAARAGVDAIPTLTDTADQFRLRVTVRPEDISAAAPLPNPAFLRFAFADDIDNPTDTLRLQFAQRTGSTCGDEAFADMTGATPIRFFDNASAADDDAATINANDPSNDSVETYNEDALFTASDVVDAGDTGLWDFSLETNAATPGSFYCFQVSDDTGGDVGMNVFPTVRIASVGGSGSGGGGFSCPLVSGSYALEGGAETTGSREISVAISGENAQEAILSENPSFIGAEFQTVPENGTVPFTLSEGLGEKTVYVLIRNRCSQTPVTSTSIGLVEATEVATQPEIPAAPEEAGITGSTVLACDATRLEWFAELPSGTARVIDATTARIEVLSPTKTLYRFEDNVDNDFNDLVLTVDTSDCLRPSLDLLEADAGWDHRVGVRYFLAGKLVGERIVEESSRLALLDKRGPVFSEFPASGDGIGLSGDLE